MHVDMNEDLNVDKNLNDDNSRAKLNCFPPFNTGLQDITTNYFLTPQAILAGNAYYYRNSLEEENFNEEQAFPNK
jgi:hypothetical protein